MLILRAIYGCIKLVIQWYKFYSEKLLKKGFKLNPYDRFVVNKLVNGKQCTLVCYVDNKKVSHM